MIAAGLPAETWISIVLSAFRGTESVSSSSWRDYIAAEADAIPGFVAVAPSEIEIDAFPVDRRRQLPRYPLTVLRVARLAVAEQA
ncbi:hypothetical protein [Thiocapsa marina]|uniref:Uncharacterized protein n=1 Tax=Thiocapsa marina 5811 TaxID=768671 RepID=F9U6D5_9GAMM|nr:hypothetical protein [Thiocapsa marina]EGV20708.1 hypothetical protein ThimaDRAFT_0486 [Thiocapsa marina 5811]